MSKRVKTSWLLVVVAMVCAPAMAEEAKPAASPEKAAAPAEPETKSAKSHEVEAEVVSVDSEKNTITLKTTAGESTAPVEAKAQATLSALKPGQKVKVVCRDDEKGEHKAVTEIKTEAPAEKPAQ